jgi:poly [ADP-ribose] polymerase
LARPPLLDNVELIKTKTEMIDNLLEIEIAYSMLDESNNTVEGTEHPIDTHYKKLKCDLVPVDQNSEEFQLIEQYMTKTHAKTHDQFTLKLRELFKTTRDGEFDRFKNFQTLDNHQLLWHGSRTTNFAGILSQGLRIAPPEAPVVSLFLFLKIVFIRKFSSRQVICLVKVFILLIWFRKVVCSI